MYTDNADSPFKSIGRNQYIVNGTLQMKRVMEKFYQHFTEIYGNSDWKFFGK